MNQIPCRHTGFLRGVAQPVAEHFRRKPERVGRNTGTVHQLKGWLLIGLDHARVVINPDLHGHTGHGLSEVGISSQLQRRVGTLQKVIHIITVVKLLTDFTQRSR